MGLLDRGSIGRYHDNMTGRSGAKAAKQAARIQGAAIDEARATLEPERDQLLAGYQPYTDAGQSAFAELAQSSTLDGMGQRLNNLQNSDMYRSLSDQRMSDANRYLNSQGISRSTAGGERIGDISMETLLGLEQMMAGRQGQIANQGYNALGQQTGITQGYGDAIRNMIMQKAGVQAGGILGAQQARAQGSQNQYTAIHNVGSGLMGMFGMGGGSSQPTTAAGGGYQGDVNSGYAAQFGGYA